jgi:hypothetical protein
MKRRTSITVLSALALAATASLLLAGPLNPPAGPVTSTSKALTEVEPRIAVNTTNTPGDSTFTFRITQPGSYYLTSNVEAVAGKAGIQIASSNVTLDLNGFTLRGTGATSLQAVASSGTSVVIKNGIIKSWGSAGVATGAYTTVQNMTIESVGNVGIALSSGIVENCVVRDAGTVGIQTGVSSTVRDCTVLSSGSHGIQAASFSQVRNCISSSNGGNGILALNSTIVGCSTHNNTLSGVRSDNLCTIIDCIALQNTLDGFELTAQDTITGSTSNQNDGNGISAGSRCRIEDNTCNDNGSGSSTAAGILLKTGGSRNHVKNNTLVGNDWGIKVDSTLNLITGNGSSSNATSNFTIAVGNRVTTIVNLTTNAALINGNSGGTSTAEADANYAY